MEEISKEEFRRLILAGIPDMLPEAKPYEPAVNHAPKRKDILTDCEKELALKNALRYFPAKHHAILAPEFVDELAKYGRIYMYLVFVPDYKIICPPHRKIIHISRNRLPAYHADVEPITWIDCSRGQHPRELNNLWRYQWSVFKNWAVSAYPIEVLLATPP